VRLIKALEGDHILAEADLAWEAWKGYELILQVEGVRLRAWVDGRLFFDIEDKDRPLEGGAVALICEEGHMMANEVTVKPVYT
jgi:hypothetical protein